MKQQSRGIIVFYSYASVDRRWRNQLANHLSQLKRDGLIEDLHDQQLLAGSDRAQEIDLAIRSAQIILLLISADFLASDSCYDQEMQQALERHRRGEARVVPIIVRPCDWQSSPFAHLQCLPRNSKPITTWDNQDEAFVAIAQELRKVIAQQQFPPPPLSSVQRQNRIRLLKQVRTTWIEGLLEHSLHQAAWIDLHLQEQPDALENPWRLQVQELDREPHPLPSGTSIVEVYDEADGELLLLGEPGSGKTTLLLQLARTLLDRAEADERQPMPVIFNLSSWAQKQEPLASWLVEELKTKYQVPRQVARHWIDANQVLPLLDGLDEVTKEVRVACMQAITAYYHQRLNQVGFSLVICCRSEEYWALSLYLPMRRAVSILPLTKEQIDDYLSRAQSQLEGLQQALRNDQELAELARRPLMLNIFTLSYQGAALEDFPTKGTSDKQQRQVFVTYVERMFSRRGVSKHFSPQHMWQWLTFVAARMLQHGQTEFYLEYMQLDWLITRQRRLLYRILVGLFTMLASVLASMLTGVLIFVIIFGLYGGLKGKLIGGLFFGFNSGLFFGIIGGLGAGLIGGLIAGLSRIQLRERFIWSWRISKQWSMTQASGVLIGGLISGGLIGGLLFGFLGVVIGGLKVGLSFGLTFGLLGMLIGGLTGRMIVGFSANQLDDHTRLTPNQGIWRSTRNGLKFVPFFVIIFLLAGALFGVVIGGGSADLVGGLGVGMILGLVSGLSVGINFGLATFFQHFTLRILLWRANCLPWKLVPFLEEATERLLLRKIGGSYIFVHRLLLEYFASLEEPLH